MNDLDLIDICARLYNPAANGAWDHLINDPECFCAIQHIAVDESVLVFRGSTTPLDWYRDMDEMPVDDPQIGHVHGGFFRGVRNRHQTVAALLRPKVHVLGHSLGAARAMLSAGLMIANGIMPVTVRAWACPRPGFARLSQIVATCPDALWWRNHHDPVTYVPFLGGLYDHAGAMRRVDVPGAIDDPWFLLADHHLSLYRQGIVDVEGSG
jgi:hypothetical protein